MPVAPQYHYALGPVLALGAVGFLALASRWIFSTGSRRQQPTGEERPADAIDYGLLVPVSTVRSAQDAELLRAVLAAEGIRATLAPFGAAKSQVLVFRDQAARARRLVGSP
ncbi:MAG: hypothetical protein M3Z02_00155 [Actinomycetota bacterium]|nr:hypothetical protein [Actinomycetota bacterium]